MTRYLGELGFVLGVAALVPMVAALLFGEYGQLLPYAVLAVGLLAVGSLVRRRPLPRDLQRNEGLVVAAAAFALAPVLMSVPFVWQGIPWLDALFEAVSGLTTTGLSTLGSVEARPHTFLFARAWLQWIGGLGFVVLSLALILGPGLALRRLGGADGNSAELAEGLRPHARRVLAVYVALTVFGIVALSVLGAGPFDAVVHVLAAVSTGGFAPRDDSLAAFGGVLQTGVLVLSLSGAVSLPLYATLARGSWRPFARDPEVRMLLLFMVVSGLLLFAFTRGSAGSGSGGDAVPGTDVALLALTSQTTAGFSTVRVEELPDPAKAVTILSMLSGGSRGSTAGGFKLLRILLLWKLLHWWIAQTRLPRHALSEPTLGGEPIGRDELLRVAATLLLFLVVLVASWVPFLALGHDPLDALFEVASATGTVGLSTGISCPDLEPPLKAVLCVDMLLGRLEVFAIVVALSPRTWIGRKASR